MSADPNPGAVTLTAPVSVPDFGVGSRRRLQGSQGADAARPLGPTAEVLQVRRRLKAARAAANDTETDAAGDQLKLSTADGALTIILTASSCGLCVERTLRRPIDTHLRQYMMFTDAPAFFAWCDGEPVRFSDALLYARLQRHGNEHFGAGR